MWGVRLVSEEGGFEGGGDGVGAEPEAEEGLLEVAAGDGAFEGAVFVDECVGAEELDGLDAHGFDGAEEFDEGGESVGAFVALRFFEAGVVPVLLVCAICGLVEFWL